jgi:hypothetical protein
VCRLKLSDVAVDTIRELKFSELFLVINSVRLATESLGGQAKHWLLLVNKAKCCFMPDSPILATMCQRVYLANSSLLGDPRGATGPPRLAKTAHAATRTQKMASLATEY